MGCGESGKQRDLAKAEEKLEIGDGGMAVFVVFWNSIADRLDFLASLLPLVILPAKRMTKALFAEALDPFFRVLEYVTGKIGNLFGRIESTFSLVADHGKIIAGAQSCGDIGVVRIVLSDRPHVEVVG